jgi:hypothetical protein
MTNTMQLLSDSDLDAVTGGAVSVPPIRISNSPIQIGNVSTGNIRTGNGNSTNVNSSVTIEAGIILG